MALKITHCEIVGKDAEKLQSFYKNLFGWTLQPAMPGYGIAGPDDAGVGVGVGASPSGQPHLTFYVEVPDVAAALKKAESLGAKTIMPPTDVPNMVTFALLADPEGNVVGVVKPLRPM